MKQKVRGRYWVYKSGDLMKVSDNQPIPIEECSFCQHTASNRCIKESESPFGINVWTYPLCKAHVEQWIGQIPTSERLDLAASPNPQSQEPAS